MKMAKILHVRPKYKKLLIELFCAVIKDLLKSACIAVMTAFFLFFGNILFNEYKSIKDTKDKFQALSLGEYREYVDSMFGIPRFVLHIDKSIQTCFYITDIAIFQCIYDENQLVGFMMTLKEKENHMELSISNMEIKVNLGIDSFYKIRNDVEKIQVNLANGGGSFANSYYRELYYLTGIGHYNTLVLGVEPIGFLEYNGFKIIEKAFGNTDHLDNFDFHKQRMDALPNTVGLIEDEYISYVDKIVKHHSWIVCVDNLSEGRLEDYNEDTE